MISTSLGSQIRELLKKGPLTSSEAAAIVPGLSLKSACARLRDLELGGRARRIGKVGRAVLYEATSRLQSHIDRDRAEMERMSRDLPLRVEAMMRVEGEKIGLPISIKRPARFEPGGVPLEAIREWDERSLVGSGWSDGPVLQPGDSWTADLGNGIVISGIVPPEAEA